MNTNDKTLADVQPGGRVRLGDQAELGRHEFQAWTRELLPCPFCGNVAEFVPYKDNGLTLKCKSMGCIQRNQRTLRYGIDWLRTSMAEHWNTRALSAQPSPGGQGDQRSDLVPGIVRCAKCQFQLVRSNLNMYDGTVTAGDSKTEPCPNGCGPLWPLTWETWAREGWAEAERLHLENAALSAQPSPGGQGDQRSDL
ncbi:hypothetical protein, partial [Stenotrophomonas pavanii]|uniref:hypothetical protein n=1 Tax=Stenotrophomonas pavanii TaxID=487698 RepID=UPI0039C5C92A